MTTLWLNPFIEQHADPFILRHEQHCYFIASALAYDRLELRRSSTLPGLRHTDPVAVWHKPGTVPAAS